MRDKIDVINILQEIAKDYEDAGDKYAFYVVDYCIHHIMELRPAAEPRWIPCSDRLPEEEVQVLVTDDAGGLATIDVDCGYFDEEYGRFEWFHSQNVTAWMPLPEPWKGEEDG